MITNVLRCAAFLASALFSTSAISQPQKLCTVNETFRGLRTHIQAPQPTSRVTISGGDLISDASNSKIGYYIARFIDLGLNSLTPGPNGMQEIVVTFVFPDGTFTSVGVEDVDRDSRLVRSTIRAVTGGTGRYAGARGTVETQYVKDTGAYLNVVSVETFCEGR